MGTAVEFSVDNAGARAHILYLSAGQNAAVAHGVHMGQLTLRHISDDLHVGVGMKVKAAAGLDQVVIDHPQDTVLQIVGVVVFSKGKMVPALQPAFPALSHLIAVNSFKHGRTSFKCSFLLVCAGYPELS